MEFLKDTRVEGKVARIDYNSVVINRGSDHGVLPNMVFYIAQDIQVDDPDTGESLGSLRHTSDLRLVAQSVYPLFTVLSGPHLASQRYQENIQVGSTVVSAGYYVDTPEDVQPEDPKPGVFERIRAWFQ